MINAIRDFWQRKGPRTRLEKILVYGSLGLFIFLVTIGITFAIAREKPIQLTYENRTGQPVEIYVDGYYRASLQSGDACSDKEYGWSQGKLVEAVDSEGHVVFSTKLFKDDLESIGRRVSVTRGQEGLPTRSGGDCFDFR